MTIGELLEARFDELERIGVLTRTELYKSVGPATWKRWTTDEIRPTRTKQIAACERALRWMPGSIRDFLDHGTIPQPIGLSIVAAPEPTTDGASLTDDLVQQLLGALRVAEGLAEELAIGQGRDRERS